MVTAKTVRLVLTETEAWFLRRFIHANETRLAATDRLFSLDAFVAKVEATQFRLPRPQRTLRAAAAAVVLLTESNPAFAGGTGGGGGLPWESTLTTIQNSLSGPVASAVAVITIVAAGMILAMGGIGTLARIGVSLVLGLSLTLAANNVITTLFPAGGALF